LKRIDLVGRNISGPKRPDINALHPVVIQGAKTGEIHSCS